MPRRRRSRHQQQLYFISVPVSVLYDAFDGDDGEESDSGWSVEADFETTPDHRAKTVNIPYILETRSPGETPAETASLVLGELQETDFLLDIGTFAHVLGQEGAPVFLTGLQERGKNLTWFRAQAQKRPSFGPFKPYNPFPAIVATLLNLPLLTSVVLSFHISHKSFPSLLSLLYHPTIESLMIVDHGFDTPQLLHTFLRAVAQHLPVSPLRHLSLAGTHVDPDVNLVDDILALLETGRAGGLEYLNLEGFYMFREGDDWRRLLDLVENRNSTILGIRFQYHNCAQCRPRRQKLRTLLARNRDARDLTHAAAIGLLPTLRGMFLRPHIADESSSSSSTPFALLPTEVTLQIIALLPGVEELTSRQMTNVVEYAADRGTLSGDRKVGGVKEFLDEVDCWKGDGWVDV